MTTFKIGENTHSKTANKKRPQGLNGFLKWIFTFKICGAEELAKTK